MCKLSQENTTRSKIVIKKAGKRKMCQNCMNIQSKCILKILKLSDTVIINLTACPCHYLLCIPDKVVTFLSHSSSQAVNTYIIQGIDFLFFSSTQ